MLQAIVKLVLWPIFMLVARPKVYNSERLKVKGSAIYVINHISMIDPVVVAFISPRFVHFMAKKELFTGFGKVFFKSLLAFPVSRHSADIASLKQAIQVLQNGSVFGIFPEGKRSVTGEMDKLENGTAFLALKSGSPVIPLFIDPESYKKLKVRVAVGRPVSKENLDGMSRGSMLEEFTRRLTCEFGSLKKKLEAEKCSC